ncbi:MAG: hypothetical protein ABI907_11560 [Ramlibacter sp.]
MQTHLDTLLVPSLSGLLIAAFAFCIAFLVVRTIARRKASGKQQHADQAAQKSQSRQVRRARARRSQG